jgi:hypothetical protein
MTSDKEINIIEFRLDCGAVVLWCCGAVVLREVC